MVYTEYTENDRKNIDQWLKSNDIKNECGACIGGTFELRDGIITPQYMDFDGGVLTDEGFPMITFECSKCSNLRFFSLYKILPYLVD